MNFKYITLSKWRSKNMLYRAEPESWSPTWPSWAQSRSAEPQPTFRSVSEKCDGGFCKPLRFGDWLLCNYLFVIAARKMRNKKAKRTWSWKLKSASRRGSNELFQIPLLSLWHCRLEMDNEFSSMKLSVNLIKQYHRTGWMDGKSN